MHFKERRSFNPTMSFANQELKEKEKNSGGKKTKKAETSKGFLDMWAVY